MHEAATIPQSKRLGTISFLAGMLVIADRCVVCRVLLLDLLEYAVS
jgi:hypothetical protein